MAEVEIVEYSVPPSDAGSRVDRILRRLLPGVPLARINRMLRRGEVKRLGTGRQGPEALRGSDRAGAGDVFALALGPDDAEELRALLAAGGVPTPAVKSALALTVLHEDDHVIALDKPAGIAAHPGSSHPLAETVLGALLSMAGEVPATFRPSLVGRLDRDASGVQLAGKSPQGLRGLEALSRGREIRKAYLALVRGEALGASGRVVRTTSLTRPGRVVRTTSLTRPGRIDLPLRDRGSGRARMQPAPDAADALAAVTDYRVLARGGGASLVEVEPRTGRRHQIRAHFAHAGAPLAGDVRYGDRAWNVGLRERAGLRRLFLHCARASFAHPVTGAAVTIVSPLPKALSSVVTRLGIRAGWEANA